MTDEAKKLIVDDDWKEEARREKEKLAEQEASATQEKLPEASLMDVINVLAIQAMVGLGMMAGPQGERIPPHLEVARHFIDLLQVLQARTRGNLTPDEQRALDGVTYDLRMRYVEVVKLGAGEPPPSAEGPHDEPR
jgi:hypothetical protein